MAKHVVGSILHGAYGDLYEQALCLKHYATTHPEIQLKLFAATTTRLESFRALDLSFASSFELWTEIDGHDDIGQFFQFQVRDQDLQADVLKRLSQSVLAKFDLESNHLPWVYMRDHGLIPAGYYQLGLSEPGRADLGRIKAENGIADEIWKKPTISFLWRFRQPGAGAISSFGQKPQGELASAYSAMFRALIARCDCHVLICGMNVVTDDTNRNRTDNKYPEFGLDLPAERATYMKGLSWPLELEIASRATVSCGHASGFTEGLWLKRGRDMVLMDAPPHYLAKAAYHRMPLFHLNRPVDLAIALFSRSAEAYRRRIEAMLRNLHHDSRTQ